MSKNIGLILVGLTTILIAAAGYLILQNQKILNKSQLQTGSPSPQTESSPSQSAQFETQSPLQTPSPSPAQFELTAALTQNAIKTNVNSKNYQGLIPYITTPNVFVVLQATECCGTQTPQEAATQMSYIDSGIPFDFNQESETVKNLKSKNPPLSESYIGISTSNEQLIAFKLDNQNHIANIEMSASWKLYNQ